MEVGCFNDLFQSTELQDMFFKYTLCSETLEASDGPTHRDHSLQVLHVSRGDSAGSLFPNSWLLICSDGRLRGV